MTPFSYVIYIGRPASVVWDALVTKATVDRYYMCPLMVLEPVVGGRVAYGGTSALIDGTVTEVTVGASLTHSFQFVGWGEPATTARYEIEPMGDALCLLRITHDDFTAENRTYFSVCEGWPVIASSLKSLLETGEPLHWPTG